jgi:hypothetical protein
MGLRPTQGDEKTLRSSNYSLCNHCSFLCHPERSRGIRGSADPSWKCFSTERNGAECVSFLPSHGSDALYHLDPAHSQVVKVGRTQCLYIFSEFLLL